MIDTIGTLVRDGLILIGLAFLILGVHWLYKLTGGKD